MKGIIEQMESPNYSKMSVGMIFEDLFKMSPRQPIVIYTGRSGFRKVNSYFKNLKTVARWKKVK